MNKERKQLILENGYKGRNFMVWLFLFSSFMFFAALASAFIVQLASSDSYAVEKAQYPIGFVFSTIIIILSSFTMEKARNFAKSENLPKEQNMLLLTLLLGILFFISQLYAWNELISEGIFFVSANAGNSFIYVFTGSHLLHVFIGFLLILNCIWGLKNKIPHKSNKARLYKTTIYWHFIGIIWLYLYVFLLIY